MNDKLTGRPQGKRGTHPRSLENLAKGRAKLRAKPQKKTNSAEHTAAMRAAKERKRIEREQHVPHDISGGGGLGETTREETLDRPQSSPAASSHPDVWPRPCQEYIKPEEPEPAVTATEPEPVPAPPPAPRPAPPFTPHMQAVMAGKIPGHPPAPSLPSCPWCWKDWEATHATESEGDRRARLAVERRFLSNARDVEDSWRRGSQSRPGPSPRFKSLCDGLL